MKGPLATPPGSPVEPQPSRSSPQQCSSMGKQGLLLTLCLLLTAVPSKRTPFSPSPSLSLTSTPSLTCPASLACPPFGCRNTETGSPSLVCRPLGRQLHAARFLPVPSWECLLRTFCVSSADNIKDSGVTRNPGQSSTLRLHSPQVQLTIMNPKNLGK